MNGKNELELMVEYEKLNYEEEKLRAMIASIEEKKARLRVELAEYRCDKEKNDNE